jgi:FtsP/CotA-like multicopper oxidase with cupredoxin domain
MELPMTHISSALQLDRRQILKLAGYGALGLIANPFLPFANISAASRDGASVPETAFQPDLDLSLIAQPDALEIFPGDPTRVWRYHAVVHAGDPNRVVSLPGSYLGPIIRMNRGEKIRIRFANRTPERSNVHWHGLHVPSSMDGHPRDVVPEGGFYLYEFVVNNRAGTYWYHPHPDGRTGPQVYHGLAGLFIVADDAERSLQLPSGEYDVPLVIQDRTFGRDNQLIYTSGHPMEQMNGFLGDRILVNGVPDYSLAVATTTYRLRLLNGSNSRIYRLAWEDGRPLTVIGTDGGLLAAPVTRQYAFLGPGERLEIWSDFSQDPVGYRTALLSLPFDAGGTGNGMMMGRGGMASGRGLLNGTGLTLFRANVTKREKSRRELPRSLAQIGPKQDHLADNFSTPKRFYLTMNHMQWSINGRVFQMEGVADDEIVRLGSSEIWEFHNTGGGMMHMMNMPHPIHLHGKSFRVLDRSGVRHSGYVDDGWKDTVLLMPGERIRILVNFDDYPGMFLYHCHNLEHEDMGMMRNYFVMA